jgi:hypothetical protein
MKNIVFDTNAYRNFVKNKDIESVRRDIARLKELELENGFKPSQNIIVLTELIRHLADINDYDFSECKHALAASALHNRIIVNSQYVYSFCPTIELLLYKELTGEKEEISECLNLSISHFAHQLEQNFSNEFIVAEGKAIRTNFQNTTNNRLEFYSALQKVLLAIDPTANDWRLFKADKVNRRRFLAYLKSKKFDISISHSFLLRIQLLFPEKNIKITDEKIDSFRMRHPAVIEMNRQFLISIVNGLDLKEIEHERWNSFNDIMIIMSSKLDSENWILISDDKQIKAAYHKCCLEENIKSLSEYLEILKF